MPTKYDAQSKINVHEIYGIVNEIILQHEKKSKHSPCIPIIIKYIEFLTSHPACTVFDII